METTNLQQKFTELKTKIDENKLLIARYETTLEQKEKELAETVDKLEELTGTTDLQEIEKLQKELEARIVELTEEANKIITEACL